MAKVRLFERSRVSPRGVGQVKPPDLREQSALGFGAELTGAIFDDLGKVISANEISEYVGNIKLAQQKAETKLTENPGMPPEGIAKLHKELFADIESFKSGLTLPQSKIWGKNFDSQNLEFIEEQFKTGIAEILVGQQLKRSTVNIKRAIEAMDKAGLELIYFGDGTEENPGLSGTMLHPKTAKANFEAGLAEIDILDKEVAFNNAVGDAYNVWEDTGDLQAVNDSIQKDTRIPHKEKHKVENIVETRAKNRQEIIKEKLEAGREVDRGNVYDVINAGQFELPDGTISTDVRGYIESTSLSEKEQESMWQKSMKETERKSKGLDIITNTKVRSQFYKEIPLMLSGAVSRDELLDRANNARFGDDTDPENIIDPTLNEKDYAPLVKAINAQYEQGYGQFMNKVNQYAEGILLKTDSLGFVENAPVRHKQLGDFQEAWMQWVAAQGENLKLSEIYPEGRRLAATFQISDTEASDREEAFDKAIREVEKSNKAKTGQTDTLSIPPDGIPQKKWDALSLDRRKEITQKWYEGPEEKRQDILKELKVRKTTKKKLTPKIARRYLDIAGDDEQEAGRLAAEDGYTE